MVKSKYIYGVIIVFLVCIIIYALFNAMLILSSVTSSIESIDIKESELDFGQSLNTLVSSTVVEDQVVDIMNSKEVKSFALNESIKASKTNKLLKHSELFIKNRYVTRDRDIDEIIDDLFQSDEVKSHKYLDELWRRAGDLQVPNEALIALKQVSMNSNDKKLAKKAEYIYYDLINFRSRLENENDQKPKTLPPSRFQNDMAVKNTNDNYQISTEITNEITIEKVIPLLYSHEYEDRFIAVKKLRLLHTPQALKLLISTAYQEYDANIRCEAIRGLWVIIADGVGNRAEGIDVLHKATYDENQSIANLARTAFNDLTKDTTK